jgi:hypothetical protein
VPSQYEKLVIKMSPIQTLVAGWRRRERVVI